MKTIRCERQSRMARMGRFAANSLVLGSLVLGGLGVGCKKKDPVQGSTAAASASAAGASAPAKAGACGEYAAKLCEAAGPSSATCQAVNTTTDLLPESACKEGLKQVKFSIDKLGEQRKSCDELTEKLCSEIGKETESCKMVTEQTKNFPPERCQQMLSHTAEIVADLKQREEKNKPLSSEDQATLTAGNVPSFGASDARVTIVEFSDFQCPYCSRAADVASKIKAKYGDKVRFVFRQFPLSFHKDAKPAAEAALAAHAQGKFWEYHDLLFQNQQKLDVASLESYAQQIGLDMPKFKSAIEKGEYASIVEADLKLGEQVTVEGTPTMFINGARAANPTDFDAISKQIDALLSKG